MPFLETLSKRAAVASLLAVIALLLATHVDLTWALKTLIFGALVAGWLGARDDGRVHPAWLLVAPLAPAVLRALTGREGPVLDMFWMAGMSGALVRSLSPFAWALPAGWRVFAGGWALTLALAWPVFVLRETGFDLRLLYDRGAINSSGLLSAPQTVGWILYVTWVHLLGLLWLDWASARFQADRERAPDAVHGLWLGVTISGVVALYQGIVDLRFLSTEFWESNARATGTMLDANAYGMSAAIAGPIAFIVLHARGATIVGAGVLLLNLAGVWMSGSRVAFLGAGIGVGALLISLWTTATIAGRRRLAVSAAAGIAGLTIVLFAGGTIGPLRRIAELPQTPTGALAAAVNRPPYGETAMQMLRDYPVGGVGVGSYQILAPDYWRQQADDALPFDSAQNWWRHEVAELGVLGGLTLLVWSLAIAWTIVTIRASRAQAETAMVVRGLLIASGICSIVQMPTHSPLVLLWFLFLLAWLVCGLRDGGPEPAPALAPRIRTAAWAVVTMLAVAYAGTHVALATGALDVAERARRLHRPYLVGTYPAERLPDGTLFRWTGQQARLQLPARSAWIVFRMWAHHPDIEERPVEIELASPCGAVFTTTLKNPRQLPVGIELPPGHDTFDATVKVSRTWSPAAQEGTDDDRQLGAGIIVEFVDDRQLVFSQNLALKWPTCR